MDSTQQTCLETTVRVPTAWATRSPEACTSMLRNLMEDIEASLYKELRSLNPGLPVYQRSIEEAPYREDHVPWGRMYALLRISDDLQDLGYVVIEDRPDEDRWKVAIGRTEDDLEPITVWGYDHTSAFGAAIMTALSRSQRLVVLAN